MFVLDTNVLSAVMGSRPVPEVATWMAAQREDLLFTTTVCQAEILAGVAVLPEGRRRQILGAAAKAIFDTAFDGRVLPFDDRSAQVYAGIFAARKRAGKSTATTDLMIAAIARGQDASVVTRDTGGFDGCGLTLINPWQLS